MVLEKKIFQHFSLQAIGRIISVILGIFIISLLMRYLGPEKYGYYSVAIAFLQIFGVVADFGLYSITLRYLGKIDSEPKENQEERTDYLMSNLFTLRFFLAIIFYGSAVLIGLFLPYPLIVKLAILILSFSLFLCTLIQFLSAFYQKVFRTEKIVKAELIGKIILLGLMFLFVKLNLGFYSALSAFALGNIVNFLLLFFACQGLVHLHFSFDFSFWKEVLAKIWPIGLAIGLNVIYFKIDTLILSFYVPVADVGFYGAAYRIFEVLITFPPLFLGLVLPQLTKTWVAQEKKGFQAIFQKSFDFLVMIAIPLVFGLAAIGPKIMILLGGPEFAVSGQILKVIGLATGILFIGELFKQAMIVLNKQKNVLPFYLIVTSIALIGYFIFIPLYSYWGAAWVTVGVESLMFILLLLYFYQQTKILPRIKFLLKSLLAGLAMFFLLTSLSGFNLFILVFIGALTYFFILFLISGFNKQRIFV